MMKHSVSIFSILSFIILPLPALAQDGYIPVEMADESSNPDIPMEEMDTMDTSEEGDSQTEEAAEENSIGESLVPEGPLEAVQQEETVDAEETDLSAQSDEMEEKAGGSFWDQLRPEEGDSYTEQIGADAYVKYYEDVDGDGDLDTRWFIDVPSEDMIYGNAIEAGSIIRSIEVADSDGDGIIDMFREGIEWEVIEGENAHLFDYIYITRIVDGAVQRTMIRDRDRSGTLTNMDFIPADPMIHESEALYHIVRIFIDPDTGTPVFERLERIRNNDTNEMFLRIVYDTDADGQYDDYTLYVERVCDWGDYDGCIIP